jgi:hypothetical protein
VILLSLLVDPFFQQLVSYPQRPGHFGINGPGRSLNFTTRNLYINGMVYNDMHTDVAMTVGLMEDVNSLASNPLCGSSNCEWPAFQTLAMCHECKDISNLLTLGCLTEDGNWSQSSNISTIGVDPVWAAPNVTSCGWFLNATSDDRMLMTGYMMNTNTTPPTPGEALWISMFPLHIPILKLSYWNGSYNFKSEAQSMPFQDIIYVMSNNFSAIYTNEPPSAVECIYRWCVQTIEAQSKDGVYSETVLSSFTNDTIITDQWYFQHLGGLAHSRHDIIITPPDQNETFMVPDFVVDQTQADFNLYMPATLVGLNSTAEPFLKSENLPMPGFPTPNVRPFDYAHWPKPNNASDYAGRLATALTMLVRNYPDSSLTVRGYGGLETYVHIQWAWVTLPLIVILGTLILLMYTVVTGPSRGEGRIWKTSLLASLLHGMGEDSRRDFGNAWELSAMREKAQSSRVIFKPELDGFRFHLQ